MAVKPAVDPAGINDVSDGGAPLSDAGIVAAVAAGGRDAVLSALLPAWKRKVHALAWSIVRDAATADDVTQETFVKVWRGLPSYDGRAQFSTWLYTIARNTALNALRARRPQAQVVAGCTDVGLWVNKMHMDFAQVLDLTRVRELRRVERYRHHVAIGAAVSLSDAFAALEQDRRQLHAFAARFAGLPVRNSGTLGGNVANGSPIGDSMPLLIALGANVVLMSERNGQAAWRELPLEKLYTGYRKNVMAADEVLAWIKIPRPTRDEFSRIYKVSKRFDDDISAVCLAIRLHLSGGRVSSASIGAGGVAATPVRAVRTEAALTGQPWNLATVQAEAREVVSAALG